MTRPLVVNRRFTLFAPLRALGVLIPWGMAAHARADDRADPTEITPAELDALWSDLYGDDPAAANAVIQLYRHAGDAVPFLKRKLPPLELTEDDCRLLLEELGDDDETVWKPAWEKLDYLDPRLAIDLETLMEEIVDTPARTRLVELCSQRKADSLAGKTVSIRNVGEEGFNFFDGRGSWWAEHRIDRIAVSGFWNRKMAWTRASRAIAVLEQINNLEAWNVLEQLAGGHPDASPTRFAKESLARIKK